MSRGSASVKWSAGACLYRVWDASLSLSMWLCSPTWTLSNSRVGISTRLHCVDVIVNSISSPTSLPQEWVISFFDILDELLENTK